MVLGLVFCFLVFIPELAVTEDITAKNLFERGRFELEDGNYEDALKFLDQAVQMDPANMSYQYARGQALVKLKRVQEAQEQFLTVLKADPVGQKGAFVDLAALYASQQQYEASANTYSQAMQVMPERGDVYLARGAVYVEMKEYDKAEADFKKAGEVNSTLVPASAYYRAMSRYRQENFAETKALLDESLSLGADKNLSEAINRFKVIVAKEERARKPWGIFGAVGLIYDDNVSLEPLDGLGVAPPGSPARDKEDWAYAFSVTGAYYPINRRLMQLGVSYDFKSLFYSDLTENDIMAHTLSVFYALNPNPWFFRIQGDMGFYYADRSEKLTLYSISPMVTRLFGKYDRTQLNAAWEYKNMKDDSDDIRRYVMGLTHFHTFELASGRGVSVRGGIQFERDDPVGDNTASSSLIELKTGVFLPLPGLLEADFGLAYAWVDYGFNANLHPTDEREDKRWTVSGKLGRAFTDNIRLDFLWTYTYNDSNLINAEGKDLYEFKRNVYSLVLSGAF